MNYITKINLKKISFFCMLMTVCIVFSTGQMAEARDFELGDIPLDQEIYEKYLKKVPRDRLDAAHPTSYDARDDGIVTSAKNQGACGSCWAFASIGALESHILKKYGDGPYNLSEQQLLSCNLYGYDCSGGSSDIIQYWGTTGPITESCFPYTASDSTPCSYSCSEMDYRISDWHTVTTSEWYFKDSCYNEGPSYFRYNVYNDFYTYWYEGSPGEVYRNSGTSFQGGHAVLIIGWDDSKGAYLCKNSWGVTGGPNGDGTFWMAYSGHYYNMGFGMVNFDVHDISPDSYVDIKANGNDDPITIAPGDPLSITITLNPGDYNGRNADWWICSTSPSGWWSYEVPSKHWVQGLILTNQTPLFPIPTPYEVLNTNTLAPGEYIFYFALDKPDGIYKYLGPDWMDYVIVNIEGSEGNGFFDDSNDGFTNDLEEDSENESIWE